MDGKEISSLTMNQARLIELVNMEGLTKVRKEVSCHLSFLREISALIDS
jgi:hypothetical protein